MFTTDSLLATSAAHQDDGFDPANYGIQALAINIQPLATLGGTTQIALDKFVVGAGVPIPARIEPLTFMNSTPVGDNTPQTFVFGAPSDDPPPNTTHVNPNAPVSSQVSLKQMVRDTLQATSEVTQEVNNAIVSSSLRAGLGDVQQAGSIQISSGSAWTGLPGATAFGAKSTTKLSGSDPIGAAAIQQINDIMTPVLNATNQMLTRKWRSDRNLPRIMDGYATGQRNLHVGVYSAGS